MAVLAQPGDRRGRLIVGAADGVVKARANENKPLMQPPYVATGAAARSSANTSPHCGRAPPNRSGPTSPARGRSPPGFMRPREILTESQGKRLLGVRLACPDITCACDLARAFADLCVTGADTCYWSGFARPKRTHGSRCRASPASSARTSTPSPPQFHLPWSSGVVEGHVNRVKTLKRAMYGWASFELLRTRILTQQ